MPSLPDDATVRSSFVRLSVALDVRALSPTASAALPVPPRARAAAQSRHPRHRGVASRRPTADARTPRRLDPALIAVDRADAAARLGLARVTRASRPLSSPHVSGGQLSRSEGRREPDLRVPRRRFKGLLLRVEMACAGMVSHLVERVARAGRERRDAALLLLGVQRLSLLGVPADLCNRM